MSQHPVHLKLRTASALLVGTLLLGGCGGVQFEGRVFDAVGLSGGQKSKESRLPDRAPLILPPKKELPAPGPRQAVAVPQSWPQDPDVALKRAAAEEKKEIRRCGEQDFKKESGDRNFDDILDPLAGCKTILGKKITISDEARGELSADDFAKAQDDLTTKKELPSPWRSETSQTKQSGN